MWGVLAFSLLILSLKADIDTLNLVKKEEFYLRGIKTSPYVSSSHFVVSDSFICWRGGDHFTLYYFDKNFDLVKKIGGMGKEPGKFIRYVSSITLSNEDEIVATDIMGRINLYKPDGEFESSFIVPGVISPFYPLPVLALKHDTFLIVSYTVNSDMDEKVAVFDLRTGKLISRFFQIDSSMLSTVKDKNWQDGAKAYVAFTPYGTVICSWDVDYKLYEYSLNGQLMHIYGDLPPHYKPLSSTPYSYDYENLEECEKWWGSWSYSYRPFIYKNKYIIVQRRARPPYYLDFYSLYTKRYLGFYKSDKPLLYVDSSYIYLCEELTDTSITIGKYVLYEKKTDTVKINSLPEMIVEKLRRNDKDTTLSRDKSDVIRSNVGSIYDLIITDVNGKNVALSEILPTNKNHLLLFVKIFDCGYVGLIRKALDFCEESKDFDFWIIVTHPYAKELKLLIEGSQLAPSLIPNLDVNNLERIGITRTPVIVATDREGKIIDKYSPFDRDRKKDFFESLDRYK